MQENNDSFIGTDHLSIYIQKTTIWFENFYMQQINYLFQKFYQE